MKILKGFTTTREQRNENMFSFRANAVGGKARRAFTLIETFVATSVLLVSLVGPLSIAAQSLRSAYYARDQVTAFYLAQEAIEYVRAKRDQNYIASGSWLAGLDTCVDATCTVDFKNFTHTVCGGGTCSPLLLSDSDQIFNTATGKPSLFTRSLTIIPVVGSPDEVTLEVTVSWVSAGISRSFQLKENLFNWL
jgi:Tfp pilus assembly protein PilV